MSLPAGRKKGEGGHPWGAVARPHGRGTREAIFTKPGGLALQASRAVLGLRGKLEVTDGPR